MKFKTIITTVVTVSCLLFLLSNAFAQSYTSILNKLGEFEDRLTALEELQENAPGRDNSNLRASIAALQREIKQLKSNLNEGDSENPEIRAALTSLRTDVDALKSDDGQEQVDALASDLRSLVGELRNTFAGQDGSGTEVTVGEDIPLEISGFGDVFVETRQGGESSDDFHLGQVEVDLETNIEEKIVIGAAIAYDAEAEMFGLGAFTVDIHLWDSEAGHFPPISGIDHSGIIAGQFDVPFGIDWYVYPSIERKLVSAPLVVENTHDGWNDYGVIGYMENRYFNAVAYGTNGFGYEAGVDINGDPIEVPMNFAAGGRLGITPHEYLEVGGSYTGFMDENNELDMSLMGADVQLNYEKLSVKGEYIAHSMGLAGDSSITNSGYYGQGLFSFGRYYVVGRYGVFSVDEDGVDDITRLSVGAGWSPADAFELRYEYQANSEENDDVSYFQLVVGF